MWHMSGVAEDLLQAGLLLDDEDLILAAATLLGEDNMEEKRQTFRFDFNTVSDEGCWRMFRFKKEDISHLRELLQIPEVIQTENRSVFSGIDAICITLRRLAYPCRLSDLSEIFGRTVSDLSLILKFVIQHIVQTFNNLLTFLNKPWLDQEHLRVFANAVQDRGDPLHNCWGFIDGTVFPVCRPKQHQRQLFSGHKSLHCLKFQSIYTPNGLVANLSRPFIGRIHDAGMFRESEILLKLQEKVDEHGQPFYL